MPWTHVFEPTKGMVTSRAPTGLEPQMSPWAKGIIMRDGEVRSDFGMTNFPEPGDLKTNALNGTVMLIDQFYLLNGNSHLMAFTVNCLYEYNTSTTTWDVAIQGNLINNTELAFTAAANVTSTRDTVVKLRGTYSSKNVVAAGHTTGIVAYSNTITVTDISAASNTFLSFWFYSTVALAAGDYRVRLSEESAGGVGATYAEYNVPAITASTWTHCLVAIASPAASNGGTYPDDLNALLSVAVTAVNDKGALTCYIDDIRTIKKFTGDEDNKFSVATLNDIMIITNGIDQPSKLTISGGLTHGDATTTLPTGSITTCEIVLAFKDHMFYMNNTENGGDAPQRASWSDIGDIELHTAGTAGFQDLLDDESWVVGAAILSENEVAIYKERSIVQCVWVGGHTPFRFKTIISGTGAINKDCITQTGGGHTVLGPDVLYEYNGTKEIEILDDFIKREMYGRMDGTYLDRAFLMYVEEDDELQVWFAVETAFPDEAWTLNIVDENWYIKDRTITGYGFYQLATSKTIGDLIGTIGEQDWTFGSQLIKANSPITLVGNNSGTVFQLDKTTLDNASSAITNEFQTPDFVLPDRPEYMNMFMRVNQFKFEAVGQSVTTQWSDDGGLTWRATQGAASNVVALTSVYEKIRFRFINTLSASGFRIRYYGFSWEARSGRK